MKGFLLDEEKRETKELIEKYGVSSNRRVIIFLINTKVSS